MKFKIKIVGEYDLAKPILFILFLLACSNAFMETDSIAQVLGEKAEMERLEKHADDAIANGDPAGSSLSIGRAALMASILAQKAKDPQIKHVYRGIESLFRAQENGFRSIALFEQAGGQTPASLSVCQLLTLAKGHGETARSRLTVDEQSTDISPQLHHQRYVEKTQEWIQIIKELELDFACSS
jgi:hypothetical protein